MAIGCLDSYSYLIFTEQFIKNALCGAKRRRRDGKPQLFSVHAILLPHQLPFVSGNRPGAYTIPAFLFI